MSVELENIAKAIVAVMKEVKGIDKGLTVGSGNSSYKGVADQDVKKEIGKAMEKHGLCLLPVGVEPTLQIDRWEETGGQYGPKQKQQVFTSVKTKYLLLHESGESIEISGYGHGVDSQDKAAGKATTYALKYALLYTFMVPTGKIDDAENEHSDNYEAPKRQTPTPVKTKLSGKAFEEACARIDKGEIDLIDRLKATYNLDANQIKTLDGKKQLQPLNQID
jgi:hypothetical protein